MREKKQHKSNKTDQRRDLIIQEKKKKRKKRRRIICTTILCAIAALLIGALVHFMPTYTSMKNDAYKTLSNITEDNFLHEGNTVIYDADGNLLGKLGNEEYKYIEESEISDYVKNGYIYTEDRTFASHHGVDYKALLRAAIKLIKNKGEITQGGSTITMQVVKNNLLTQERTYERKLLELMIAPEIEKQFSKNQIMEFYCNSNYYGENCYGIEAAAQYYFGVSAKDLTLAEAAMLVGTSNSPNAYNPVADYEKATKKKEQVLGNMLEYNAITKTEYDIAMAENPEIVKKKEKADSSNYMIDYAVYCAAIQTMKQDGFTFQYTFEDQKSQESYKELYKNAYSSAIEEIRGGGYRIDTAFDIDKQNMLQESVDDSLSDFEETQENGKYDMQGAATCIDNKTGLVVAIVGGRGSEDQFNRAFLAARQPGSSIKPLVDYGPAINEGEVKPSTVLVDEKTELNGYSPKNSGGGYRGKVTVREALARSINTIALQLYELTGREKVVSYLDQFKFTTLSFGDTNNAAISVGAFTNGVTTTDMAKAYSAIENDGKYRDVGCITKISTLSGKQIYSYEDTKDTEVFTSDTSFILKDMMQGVFREEYGTAHSAEMDDQYYAGKTGTTNDNKDAWFCGFSPYYTTTVWVGCDTPKSVDGLYGNSYPLDIFESYMNKIHEGLEVQSYDIPTTIILEKGSEQKDVDYSGGDVYGQRPEGWDYTSKILLQKILENEKEAQTKAMLNSVENAVEDFEDFRVESTDDAKSIDEKYYEVLDVIDKLNDTQKQSKFRERIAYKYKLLQEEVETQWQDALKAEQEDEELKRQEEITRQAQEDAEEAYIQAKETRISRVEELINDLNDVQYYTDNVDTLAREGADALSKCRGYEEYSSLDEKLDAAIEKAKNRPIANDSQTSTNTNSETENANNELTGGIQNGE